MKNQFLVLASFLGLMANSQFALAAFTIDELQGATKIALENFKKENVGHVEHFTGYKSWLSGDDSKVKVYVNHDGMTMEFNYLCHKHDASTECHNQ